MHPLTELLERFVLINYSEQLGSQVILEVQIQYFRWSLVFIRVLQTFYKSLKNNNIYCIIIICVKIQIKLMQAHDEWISVKEPVWVFKNHQFLKAIIKQIYKDVVTCMFENGDTVKVKRTEIFQRNLISVEYTRNDLMENDVINQPEILQHLALRFQNNRIYTFVESTLIAVNPYKTIPQLYTEQLKDMYIRKIVEESGNIKDFQPHIYAITSGMIKSLFEDGKDQAVIISGESGAGKTQVNKQCLRFLQRYFKKVTAEEENGEQSNIQKAIMLSNPILQAFGNSKTIRNNNSSRFGKFLKIVLDSSSKKIKHAQIYNYLLEKSRIISRSKQQQNFHVLYQFLINTTPSEKVKYFLVDQKTNQFLTFQHFSFTKNETQTEYFPNPQVTFAKIKQSLTILPDQSSFDYLCRILSAVLHLGNLQVIEDQNNDKCQIVPFEVYDTICLLLQVDKKLLFESLTIYRAKIGGQQMVKQFSKRQIEELIHSLAKTLYQRLFQWIIQQINKSTKTHDNQGAKLVSLGFLDIYGFEVLKTNSLEQLFINYTNERLHQLYLHKIFKLQKQYFITQKLESKFQQIDFQDNIKVLQLIDYQKLSLFNLLDQWCTIASPDQSTLINKFRFNHKKHQKFPPSNMTFISTIFAIRHTPQDVQYSVIGFREKNKDLLRQQIKKTMISSKLNILKDMFSDPINGGEIEQKSQKVKKFLSLKFRKEMNQLMDGLLNKTQQHFIRCIKSNGNKRPIQVDQQMVYSQIKYLGILDTIKIKKMGYCIKPKYQQLDRKFPWVVRKSYMKQATPEQIKQNIKKFLPKFGQQHILYGNSKVFFKDSSYSVLMRKYAEYQSVLKIKAMMIAGALMKSRYIRRRDQKIRNRKIVIKYAKGFLGYIDYIKMYERVSLIQKALRQFLEYRSQAKKFQSIEILQNYIKRNVQSILRVKRMNLVKKVIYTFKYQKLKRKVKAKLFAKQFVEKFLINRAWNQIKTTKLAILNQYFHSFKIKILFRSQIHLASRNQLIARQGRSLQRMQTYLLAFSSILVAKKKLLRVNKLQSNIRTYMIRIRYERIRNSVIQIQRTLRQYLLMKVTAKATFQKAYHSYQKQLLTQNKRMQSRLYDTDQTNASQINGSVKKFLGKFKQKISLIYLIIDVQAFVDMEITYPKQSWMQNYIQCFNEGLEKNDPIQQLTVGQTFTIAASTNKMYLWGMHESSKNLQPSAISTVKTKMPVQFFQISHNKLKFLYVKQDENNDRKNQAKTSKTFSTIIRDFTIENYKLYQCIFQQLILIKEIPPNEKVLQVSCGSSHTIFRSPKKVFTFGIGREGQLGHSIFNSEQKPRSIKFFQNNKTSYPIQVAASFTSSLVLLSNHKLYWFGKNATLSQVCIPTLFQLKSKCQTMNNNQFAVGRVLPTWSRSMSVIGVTVLCFNKKFQNNISLRNKITDILITKWQQAGIYNINPPIIPSVSDHLQQCHIKLRNKKINIYPQSKNTLKQMQEKVKSIGSIIQPETITNRNSVGTEFSFANTQHNSVVR